MELFLLYVFSRLDTWSGLLCAASVVCGIFFVILIGPARIDVRSGSDEEKTCFKWAKRAALAFLFFSISFAVLPKQKDAAIILAGLGVLEVAKSEASKRIASKSVELIEQTLDSYLKKNEK